MLVMEITEGAPGKFALRSGAPKQGGLLTVFRGDHGPPVLTVKTCMFEEGARDTIAMFGLPAFCHSSSMYLFVFLLQDVYGAPSVVSIGRAVSGQIFYNMCEVPHLWCASAMRCLARVCTLCVMCAMCGVPWLAGHGNHRAPGKFAL